MFVLQFVYIGYFLHSLGVNKVCCLDACFIWMPVAYIGLFGLNGKKSRRDVYRSVFLFFVVQRYATFCIYWE